MAVMGTGRAFLLLYERPGYWHSIVHTGQSRVSGEVRGSRSVVQLLCGLGLVGVGEL